MEGHVYFIKAAESDLIKIGRTNGPAWKRKKEIQNMCPVDLYTLGALRCPDYVQFEREMHELFAPYREHGEWFRLGRRQRAALKKCFRKKREGGGPFDVETFKAFWKREIAKDDWI